MKKYQDCQIIIIIVIIIIIIIIIIMIIIIITKNKQITASSFWSYSGKTNFSCSTANSDFFAPLQYYIRLIDTSMKRNKY